MQRGADVARLRHRLDDVVGEFGRVWGGEPDPLQPVDVSAGPQQLGESSPITGQCGVGERDAVGVDVLAEQGDFEHTVVHQGPHLGQDVCRAAVTSLPRSDGTMQNVQLLLQPTEMETHAA